MPSSSWLVDALTRCCLTPGAPIGLTVVPGVGLGLAAAGERWAVPTSRPAEVVAELAEALRPRWVWWSAHTARSLAAEGVRPRTCWDLGAVHRVLHGGGRDDSAVVWAAARGLPEPAVRQPSARSPRLADARQQPSLLDLVDQADDQTATEPVGDDGQLALSWAERDWTLHSYGDAGPADTERVLADAARWSALALDVRTAQAEGLAALPDPRLEPRSLRLAELTAYAESAAALLAVELEHDGLPVDARAAEEHTAGLIGPRPASPEDEVAIRAARDAEVLRGFPVTESYDLRNPTQVRALLKRAGFDLPDTRSWRLEPFRASHAGVAAFLDWRKAERIATTYGYHWLDDHIGDDGRLHGSWGASDGASGRMTARAGLHNLPASLRVAVVAERGNLFVRADLGQIEPRVLAVVSGDTALAAAAREDDMYAPVAEQLHCDRPTAKVAVLAAMYGQTSGAAGEALRRMEVAYPKALAYLRSAEESGRTGVDIRTWGGRLIRLRPRERPVPADEPFDAPADQPEPADADSGLGIVGRGRFARNAVIQGAAAELFKAWAATVRTGMLPFDGRIVLCLHDELLLHVPAAHAQRAADLLQQALESTTAAWAAGSGVRFVADCTIVERWSDAK